MLFALWRFLHFMLALRNRHTMTSILDQKNDVDSAFKRIMLILLSALKNIVALGSLAFISLRSTFEGKHSYSNFSLLVEPLAEIMNESLTTDHLNLYQTRRATQIIIRTLFF